MEIVFFFLIYGFYNNQKTFIQNHHEHASELHAIHIVLIQ